MGAPGFKDCIKADLAVFLNPQEFADTHTLDGRQMTVLVDENELLERDKAKLGTHMDGLYKARRLIYVSRKAFGKRPANGRQIEFDGRLYRVEDCTEEAGVLAIELGATKT